MKIAVVGARLAGSYVSLLLSQAGHEVLLLDPDPDKEKPCGGGVTGKALLTMPWLAELNLPHTVIRSMHMSAVDGSSCSLNLRRPIHIFARAALDGALRDAAIAAGTCFLAERAVAFSPTRGGWSVRTPRSSHEVQFLVGADGVGSSVRKAVIGKFPAADLSLALGYYIPGLHHPDRVLAVFQERGFSGYLWSFPRVDHSSVGILRWLPEANAADLRQRVASFIGERYPDSRAGAELYAARIPCLSYEHLRDQAACGRSWALLGDAAGFADPITAEGIYFALRSAELLAGAFARGEPLSYEQSWRADFGGDLMRAAGWRDRFYAGNFLCRSVTRRVVQAARSSHTLEALTDRLVCGETSYEELRRRLILHLPRIVVETLRNGRRTRNRPAA